MNNPPSNGFTNYTRRGYQSAKNTSYRAYSSYQGMTTLGKILVVILIIALIVAIVMWIQYTYNITLGKSRDSPFLITNPVHAYSSSIAAKSYTVPNPVDGLSYSYSIWIYIRDWDYLFGKMKNILIKGDDNGDDVCPSLALYPRTNSLKASISTYNDKNVAVESCDIQNISLNKWVNIIYVLDNRTVTIYVNGKLERSCVLRGIPKLNSSPVKLIQNGGFSGLLSKVQYFNRAISVGDIESIYSSGPTTDKRVKLPF